MSAQGAETLFGTKPSLELIHARHQIDELPSRLHSKIFKNVNKVRRRECREQYVNVVKKVNDLHMTESANVTEQRPVISCKLSHLEKQHFFFLKGVLFFTSSFFMYQCPPGPQVFHWSLFEFFRKFAEIFAN